MPKSPPRPIPCFDTPIIETHCHLDYLDQQDLDACLAQAADVGVDTLVTIAVSPDNQRTVLELIEKSDRIWGTQGIHPHEAAHWDAEVAELVRSGAAHPRIVALGEMGLDYYYEHSDRGVQATAFEAQLAMAGELDLPVVIHTRDADEDTQAILANALKDIGLHGVIHSFTSGPALAEYCLSEGFFLGFNGITTFKNAQNVRDVVAMTPLEQMVLETDSPYLTPVPYRGRVNAPRYLPFIAECVADIKGVSVEHLLQVVRDNSQRLFFKHETLPA